MAPQNILEDVQKLKNYIKNRFGHYIMQVQYIVTGCGMKGYIHANMHCSDWYVLYKFFFLKLEDKDVKEQISK